LRRSRVSSVWAKPATSRVSVQPKTIMICIVNRYSDAKLIGECNRKSIELLKANSVRGGVLAASPGPKADKRGYTAIFGRDAAVCAIGMAVSGNQSLAHAAAAGLHTLAEHQAPNGQI